MRLDFFRSARMKRDALFGTRAQTRHAADAAGIVNGIIPDVNAAGGTGFDTFSAVDAIIRNFQTEYAETGNDAEDRSDGAEGGTENPLFPNGKDHKQDQDGSTSGGVRGKDSSGIGVGGKQEKTQIGSAGKKSGNDTGRKITQEKEIFFSFSLAA